MSPKDVETTAYKAPNFKKTIVKCCYHCKWLYIKGLYWKCREYDVTFGKTDDRYDIGNLCEFVCYDWTKK